MTRLDAFLVSLDNARHTLLGATPASRRRPQSAEPATPLSDADRRLSGALMRVNHVGEVCAQALYQAQAIATRDPALRRRFDQAARDEGDHLAWTRERLDELGARPSLLNPLWYAGSFAIGWLAGRRGDARSLGFLVETERQVEQHLATHLDRLPRADHVSRAIVEQMKVDERNHADGARLAGAAELPAPVRWAMRGAATVMTTTAHYL